MAKRIQALRVFTVDVPLVQHMLADLCITDCRVSSTSLWTDAYVCGANVYAWLMPDRRWDARCGVPDVTHLDPRWGTLSLTPFQAAYYHVATGKCVHAFKRTLNHNGRQSSSTLALSICTKASTAYEPRLSAKN